MASRKGWNNKEDGWVKTFHVEVDDRTNAIFTLIYDWGASLVLLRDPLRPASHRAVVF